MSTAAARRTLKDLVLDGTRLRIRQALYGGIFACGALGAIGYLAPAHRVRGDAEFHSNFADGGITPLVVLATVLLVAAAAFRPRWGWGFLAGVVATLGAVLALLPVFLAHMFSSVETAGGEAAFAIGEIGLFFCGLALVVAEPILFLGHRRHLERDVDPQFPSARALS